MTHATPLTLPLQYTAPRPTDRGKASRWSWLPTALMGLWLLNALDAFATLTWVRGGLAAETNPLMALLLATGDAPFVGMKLLAGTLAALALYDLRHTPMARAGIMALTGIYTLTASIHFLWFCHSVSLS